MMERSPNDDADIKHKNIMVSKDGVVKLIDFGLSNFLPEDKLGETFCGTPAYAAPEMVSSSSDQILFYFIHILTTNSCSVRNMSALSSMSGRLELSSIPC